MAKDSKQAAMGLDALNSFFDGAKNDIREGHVVGGRDGWSYRHIDTTNRTPDSLRAERQTLLDRGLIPVTGTDAVESHGDLYVLGRPNVEIWAASPDVQAAWLKRRIERAHRLKLWAGAQASRSAPMVRPGLG